MEAFRAKGVVFNYTKIITDITLIAEDLDIQYINFYDIFNEREEAYLPGDWHLSEKGTTVAVDEIYSKLKESGWI